MEEPIVSVIVPVYNVEKYLERCIRSLQGQTLEAIEILLIDDGSKDGSGRLCDAFAKEDARIRVLHKGNEGQGLARNDGLDIARGTFVLFIDSDDYIEPDTCQRLSDVMKERDADLCCFGYRIETPEGKLFYQALLTEQCYEGEKVREQFALHFFGDDPQDDKLRGVSACMTMFRRSLITEHHIRFRSEREFLSEDTLFNLDFCLYAKRALVLPAWFYHYCQNADSFSHAYRPDRFALTKVLCMALREYAVRYGIEEETKKRIRMVLWVSLMECIKQETRRLGQVPLRTVRQSVKEFRDDPLTEDALRGLSLSDLPVKQKVFLLLLRYRMLYAVLFLAGIRNRQGL